MFEYIKNNLDMLIDMITKNNYMFFYLPLFLFLLGFFSVSSPLGLFLPIGVIVIGIFALAANNVYLFLLLFAALFLGNIFGLIVGYFLGKKYCNGFVCKIGTKYKNVEKAFKQIDFYSEKYNFLSMSLLINVTFAKPFMAMYFGSRNYDFKKFLGGGILASFIYTFIKALLGFLMGYFGKIILDYLQIGTKYIILGFVFVIVVAFILDYFDTKKDLE